MLSDLEKARYARHFLLPGWDEECQKKLKNTTVFVAGAGGTGSPTITMLALLGVGKIRICDFDVFEESNKNRQFLHSISDERLGMNKAMSAAKTVYSINPNVRVEYFTDKFTEDNIDDIVGDADYIFDCVDKFKYKFILADCAGRKRIPMFFYGIMGYDFFGYIFYPPKTACFNCLFDKEKIQKIEKLHSRSSEVAAMSPALFSASGVMMLQAVKMMLGYDEPAYNKFYFGFGKQSNVLHERSVRGFKFWNTKYFDEKCAVQGFDWKTKDSTDLFEVLNITGNPECPYCGNMTNR